jgi:hypothetical protein
MLESVFSEEALGIWTNSSLPADLQREAREFLATVGLPQDPSTFLFDKEFGRCGTDPNFPSSISEIPEGWENWLRIGAIGGDLVALDSGSGTVFSQPEGENRIELLNEDLESFAYFVYLIERERSHWDPARSEDEPFDPESVAVELRETMMRADPSPFEGREPGWSDAFDWETGKRMPTWDFILWQIHDA